MNIREKLATGLALISVGVGQAMAAVPTEVTTALGDAKSDGTTIASAVFVAVVAIFAFSLMRKALR